MDDGTTIKMNKQMEEFWIRITEKRRRKVPQTDGNVAFSQKEIAANIMLPRIKSWTISQATEIYIY